MAQGRRLGAWLGALAAVTATTWDEAPARACGGCIAPPPPPNQDVSQITAERMIFSVSPEQTTLYDEINFSGSPSSFAWVLPIKGTATIGLSADILFASLDQLTSSQVVPPQANCPPAPSCNGGGGGGCGSSSNAALSFAGPAAAGGFSTDEADAGASAVHVTAQEQVGPYETVQLQSSDPTALDTWLSAHGYVLPASDAPVVAAYIQEGFGFLAMKLVPGQGVNAMRPVRVTTPGAGVTLPLRMVGVGTGATTGVTLWVIGDARWEPMNFPSFVIQDSELSWDWATTSSNYEAVRLQHESALHGGGWQIENSLELNEGTITSSVTSANSGGNAATDYLPIGDAGSGLDAGAGGFFEGGVFDGSAVDDASGHAGGTVANAETAAEVEQDDLTTLFKGMKGPNVRVTRMRADLAHQALSADLTIQPAPDHSELTNLHYPSREIGEPLCPVYDQSCTQIGEAPRSQAGVAPANGCSTSATRTSLGSQVITLGCIGVLGGGMLRSRRKRRAKRG